MGGTNKLNLLAYHSTQKPIYFCIQSTKITNSYSPKKKKKEEKKAKKNGTGKRKYVSDDEETNSTQRKSKVLHQGFGSVSSSRGCSMTCMTFLGGAFSSSMSIGFAFSLTFMMTKNKSL